MIYFYLVLLSLHATFIILTIIGLTKDDCFSIAGSIALSINIIGAMLSIKWIIESL